ncbi:MAG TPA: leucyl aminopeptidase [Desulfurivibrionaceae bacterium]|nr:leucyl aminopeptidase [Desulfurivibrionaceae bacterium]
MLQVSVKEKAAASEMTVFFVRQQAKGKIGCPDREVEALLQQAAVTGDFTAKEGQVVLFYLPAAKGRKTGRRALVVGLGKEKPNAELIRKAAGTVVNQIGKTKAKEAVVLLPEKGGLASAELVEWLTEGLILGSYRFRKYQTVKDPEENGPQLAGVTLVCQTTKVVQAALQRGVNAAVAACLARDMANEPGNHWTPTHFANEAKKVAKANGLKVTVLGKAEMLKLGMGGILGVSQGSAQPPTLTILEYRVSAKAPTLLLVGKGLTFDSGGISLKPSAGMEEMKYDMSGGAAVLAAMQAVGREKPARLNVVALIPSSENLPGPTALKPGDVITHYNGKSVEVVNTDAEGRLILADALAYGVEKYKPAAVVDIATLTGAVIIGLGHHRTGLLANDDKLCDQVLAAGEAAGEPLWRLPLAPEYRKQLKSNVADLKNVDKRDGGTILGAAFLQEFVGKTPWAHLDIAGTAWNFTEKSYVPKGPSGIGVRTLLALIRNWK